MMPRRISRVPPRRVKEGACSTRLGERLLEPSLRGAARGRGATRRTSSGISRSKALPRSLTNAASRFGVSPACSMPATESDIRRKVHRCAARRPTASASRGSGSAPARRISSTSSAEGAEEALGPAALEGRARSSPAASRRPPCRRSGRPARTRRRSTTSLKSCSPARLMIGRIVTPGALRSTISWLRPAWRSVARPARCGTSAIMKCDCVRVARPHLGAGDLAAARRPAPRGCGSRPGRSPNPARSCRCRNSISPRAMRGRNRCALLLGAEAQQQRPALPVGDPMRADRRARRQQFLGHDVAFERSCARRRHIAWARSCRSSRARRAGG